MTDSKPLTEDDIYRASTQYKFWSFTADSLASLRASTNSLAAARVRDAMRRAKSSGGASGPADSVECLTVDEEQKLVGFYCEQAMKLADFCEFPTNIKATAVQYLKRFYLQNSPMTYHPKQMMPCAIFFATKTDNHYISLQKFASKIPKATEESVIAPEYLLTQGLRFTFDVRHPHRGLEGGFMELQNMAMGNYQRVGGNAGHSAQIQEDLKNLETAIDAEPIEKSMAGLQKRIQIAHQKSSMLLKTTAITCDGYFLYTPSQIWLGAFLAADEPLATFYVQTILGPSAEIMDQVIETLHSCAALLTEKSHVEEKEELRRIDKKLYKCRNPEKTDITSMHPTEKRAGDDGGLEEEKVVKKRKLAEAQRAGDDPFGPPITR